MRMLCAEWWLLASLELSNGIIHQFGYSVSENRERGEWRDEGDTQPKYLEPAKELVEKPQRNTLQVSMRDIQVHNEQLSETITREYYRVYPYLCAAIKNFVKDHVDNTDKDLYLSIIDVDIVHKVRNVEAEVS